MTALDEGRLGGFNGEVRLSPILALQPRSSEFEEAEAPTSAFSFSTCPLLLDSEALVYAHATRPTFGYSCTYSTYKKSAIRADGNRLIGSFRLPSFVPGKDCIGGDELLDDRRDHFIRLGRLGLRVSRPVSLDIKL